MAQPRSPRFVWAFGGMAPCDELGQILAREQIESGVLLADAFPSLDKLQNFAAKSMCSAQATSQLALAWARAKSAVDVWAQAGPRFSKACTLPLVGGRTVSGNAEIYSAKSLEDSAMNAVLDRAIFAAWRVGASSGLIPELRSELGSVPEVEKLLRLVFLGASGAVNTWRAAVRAVERLERWTVAHGFSNMDWTGVRLAKFLADAQHSGYSVPVSLRAGLKLMSDSLMLNWPLDHPVVLAVCKLAKQSAAERAAASQSRSLPCLTVEQLQHLEMVGCAADVPLAIRWAALLGCLLVHACLRFSDAQRSEGVKLGQSSVFGFCWRSKKRRTGFPFAALRSGFSPHPWADSLLELLEGFAAKHSLELDYVMPQFGKDLENPMPRPASYSCAVGLLRRDLALAPLGLDATGAAAVTLHACRRLLPTLASQMMMSIESRRVLGHWGPQSAEPLRYDTSRCVSELAYKAQVSPHVVAGWRPGADFEPPPPLIPQPGAEVADPQLRGDDAASPNGWVANAKPPTKGKPRCLHVLAAPGVTKCGWRFGITSRTPKTFFVTGLNQTIWLIAEPARHRPASQLCSVMQASCQSSQSCLVVAVGRAIVPGNHR